MKLIFLGTGSSFIVGEDNYQSNMILVADDGDTLLVDCGTDARHSSFEQGFTPENINNVFITHLHADHAGGLEWLAFSKYFNEALDRPNLFIADTLVKELWEDSLKAGLGSLIGEESSLETFYKVHALGRNDTFQWQDAEFAHVQTLHVMNGRYIVPSYGLCINRQGYKALITGDTQFCSKLWLPFYGEADIIFHDCETTLAHESGVHPRYEKLATLDPAIKAKMWLYHYNPGKRPNPVKDGFAGFVLKGQSFDIKKGKLTQ